MSAARAVSATFSPVGASSYTLSVTVGSGGTVTSSPAGISCGSTCSASYATGVALTLTATPATGYLFGGWSDTCSGIGSCALTMNANRSVTAVFTPTTVSANLCDGLVTDKLAHAMTSVTQPAVGASYVDPQFGTTIRRLTKVTGTLGVIKPMYSTTQAWNADESYMILYHTGDVSGVHELYQGKAPYAFVKKLSINPADLEQVYWHTSDPDVFFYPGAGTNQFLRYHVSTGKQDVVHTFADCTSKDISADSHGFMSFDSNAIGLKCSGSNKAYIYKLDTDTVVGTAVLPSGSNAPLVSASGTRAYWNGSVYTSALVSQFSLNLSNNEEHTSMGRLTNGHDTHNAVSFDGSFVGSLVTHDMTDGSGRTIVGPSSGYPYPVSGTHVSAIAFNKPGWVAISGTGDYTSTQLGQKVLENEVLLAGTEPGGSVCRIAHTHTSGKVYSKNGYWAEAHGSISPSGTRVIFGSDWENSGTVDAYVVELPSYKP